MFSCLKSTDAFNQEFSSRLEQTNLTFKLTHITFNHGLLSLHLGLEQLKDRTIKSSTMSQVLRSTIILEFLQAFKIKLRASIVWHSQVSQYMCYLWILTKAIVMSCLSLPTTKAYVELIGVEKAYLQYIYCKVKPRIQRELCYTIKSRCACVWMYGGYIWWPT